MCLKCVRSRNASSVLRIAVCSISLPGSRVCPVSEHCISIHIICCGFMCTIVEQISHKNWFTYILFLLVYLVKCDVIPRIFQLKLEMFYHYFFNHGRWLPKNRDVWQEGWKSCATFSAQRGETHCVTRALPDWTWELFKKKKLSECQHVYCMTILQEQFWCFVKFWTFWTLCFLWWSWHTPPPPPSFLPNVLSQESTQCPVALVIYNIMTTGPRRPSNLL